MTDEKVIVVTPWYREDLRNKFLEEWKIEADDPRIHLEQDKDKSGCAVTKNRGVQAAMDKGADIVIVLDDDCYPSADYPDTGYKASVLDFFIEEHRKALRPRLVEMFRPITTPPSRGTPYFDRKIVKPVAASMGFWEEVGDFDAPSQLVYGELHPMEFDSRPVYGQYFALSGMNLAFRPNEWLPWCQFIDVPRFDDIWMGWLWQKEAYRRGYCFNLNGPKIRHARASNVWKNLQDEAKYLEENETLWQTIHRNPVCAYKPLRELLPV